MEIKELKKGSKYILLSYDAPIIALGFEEYKEVGEVIFDEKLYDGKYSFSSRVEDGEGVQVYLLTPEQVKNRIIPTKLRPKDYES